MKEIIKGYIEKVKKSKINEISFMYFLSAIVFVAALGLAIWFGHDYIKDYILGADDEEANRDLSAQDKGDDQDCKFTRELDGICVGEKDEINPKLVAVMIENHPDARPQSGLSQASIVYEAPVEANYSRFMAIYPTGEQVLKVGPVRSSREYYLDWVSEYRDIMYMHVGGSPRSLTLLKEYELFDLNEFYRGWYYWRADDRYAPHNVYTSSNLWEKAWEDYGGNEQLTTNNEQNKQEANWQFGKRDRCEQDCVEEFVVSFLPPTYEATWKFNTSTDKYERYQMGYPHLDKDGGLIEADNIIIQYVETKVVDEIGRISMETIGEGEAIVFRDGFMIPAQWHKGSREDKLELRDVDFHEMIFKPGKTWIEVVNQHGSVSFEVI